jgi:hypothetical protein
MRRPQSHRYTETGTEPAARGTRTAGMKRLQPTVILVTPGRPGIRFGSSTLSTPLR